MYIIKKRAVLTGIEIFNYRPAESKQQKNNKMWFRLMQLV
jgi:hypothetical protein